MLNLALLKSHVRVDFDDDDALLLTYLQAATATFEQRTRRLLSRQTKTIQLGDWGRLSPDPRVRRFYGTPIDSPYSRPGVPLPFPPLESVTSVTYYDGDGNQQTLSSSNYAIDTTRPVPILRFVDSLPDLDPNRSDRIIITYVCGWATPPADVVRAVLELAAGYYLTRESVATIQFQPVPFGVEAIMHNRAVPELQPAVDP